MAWYCIGHIVQRAFHWNLRLTFPALRGRMLRNRWKYWGIKITSLTRFLPAIRAFSDCAFRSEKRGSVGASADALTKNSPRNHSLFRHGTRARKATIRIGFPLCYLCGLL